MEAKKTRKSWPPVGKKRIIIDLPDDLMIAVEMEAVRRRTSRTAVIKAFIEAGLGIKHAETNSTNIKNS